ncbi:MAG: DbpA RNA binding domain-containing protein, partial [Bacteroidota bacterium]
LAFINPREGRRITELERKLKVTFERIEVPTVDSLRSSRMNRWANLIIGTKVDRQAEEMLPQLQDRFAHLSKEDILKRWITTQLDHLTLQHGEVADLNETTGGKGGKKASAANYHRYYINIGTMDGVTRGDLLHFISDVGKVDRKYFGAIKLQRNCAFFEVDGSRDGGLSDRFKGMTAEGRSIRVNRDDLGPKRAGGKGSGGKSGGKGKQKKKNKRNFKS